MFGRAFLQQAGVAVRSMRLERTLQGFDQPDIGAVMLLRPTQSKVS